MNQNIVISEKNPFSNRWAVFEEDGLTGWLYLTEPNTEKPVADCWIYNQVTTPINNEINRFKNSPPPATTEYATRNSSNFKVNREDIRFKWSPTGDDVAIIINDIPIGYILSSQNRGFSRNLLKNGPWGNRFDQNLYDKVLG